MLLVILEKNIKLKKPVMFVANSCAEGLGNLKGTRQILNDFGEHIEKMDTFDGRINVIGNVSVGSHRYKVTIKTKGGHSYSLFGNRNANAVLANIISDIYRLELPEKDHTKTSYKVGTISGGTSVNMISKEAEMLCGSYETNA